jgi:hypothetical protein
MPWEGAISSWLDYIVGYLKKSEVQASLFCFIYHHIFCNAPSKS